MSLLQRLSFKRLHRSPGGRRDAGFTIVETLIVIAIGGLILLIVFEAVPALERGSRNNQRKQDVSLILQAVSHYELSDSDNFPLDCSGANACTTADPGHPNDYFLRYVAPRLTYYTANNQVVLKALSPVIGTPAHDPNTDYNVVYVYNYQVCVPNNPGVSTNQGADYNDVVALYAVETGGAAGFPQCEQL